MADQMLAGPVAAIVTVAPTVAALGAPLPIIIAAVIGAAWASANTGKLEATIRSFFTALISFGVALLLGIFLGVIVDHLFGKYVTPIEGWWVGDLVSLLSSALSLSVILPGVADRLGVEIKNRNV